LFSHFSCKFKWAIMKAIKNDCLFASRNKESNMRDLLRMCSRQINGKIHARKVFNFFNGWNHCWIYPFFLLQEREWWRLRDLRDYYWDKMSVDNNCVVYQFGHHRIRVSIKVAKVWKGVKNSSEHSDLIFFSSLKRVCLLVFSVD